MGEAFAGEMARVKAGGEKIEERFRARVDEVERMLGIEKKNSGRSSEACAALQKDLQAARAREEELLAEKDVLQHQRDQYEAESKRLGERCAELDGHSKELIKSLDKTTSSNVSLKAQLTRSEAALVTWKSTVGTTIAEQFAAERKQVAEMKGVDDALARREIEELERELREEMARNDKLVDAEYALKRASKEVGNDLAVTRNASDRTRIDAKAELKSKVAALEAMIEPEVMIQDTHRVVEGTPEAVQEDEKQDPPGREDARQDKAHSRTRGREGSGIMAKRDGLAADIARAVFQPPRFGYTEKEMERYNQWVRRTVKLDKKVKEMNKTIKDSGLRGNQRPDPLERLVIAAQQHNLLVRPPDLQTPNGGLGDSIHNPAIHTVPEEKNTALKVAQDNEQKLQYDLDIALADIHQLQTRLRAETEAKQRFEITAQLADVAKELAEEAAAEAGTQAALAKVVADAMRGERDAAREATEEARTREVDDPYNKSDLEGRLEYGLLKPTPAQASQELELARAEIASLKKALDTERTNFDNFHRKFSPSSHRRLTTHNKTLRQYSGERESRKERDERGGWTPYAREGDGRPEWRRHDSDSPRWDREYQHAGGMGWNGRR